MNGTAPTPTRDEAAAAFAKLATREGQLLMLCEQCLRVDDQCSPATKKVAQQLWETLPSVITRMGETTSA